MVSYTVPNLLLAQNHPFYDNLNILQNSSFIRFNATLPSPYDSTITSLNSLKFGRGFPSVDFRGVFYGGNLGVAQDKSKFGDYRNKWSFKGAWTKPTTLPGSPWGSISGIRYLVDYHRWGDYSAHFGLRERNTFELEPETPTYDDARDAVISWGFEDDEEVIPSRLIFQSILGTDVSISSNHVASEWATILSNGNIGSGISNPSAQFQIKPLSAPGSNLFQIINGSSNPMFTFIEGTQGGVFHTIGQQTITSPSGVTSSSYYPLQINGQSTPNLFTVRDDGNSVFTGALGLNKTPGSGFEFDMDGDAFIDEGSLWVDGKSGSSANPFTVSQNGTYLFSISSNGTIFLNQLATIAGAGNTIGLTVDNSGAIVPGNANSFPWLIGGNSGATSLLLGTTTATDIEIITDGTTHGVIKGANGFLEYNRAASFGSSATPTNDFTLTAYSNTSSSLNGPFKCYDNGGTPLFEVLNSNINMFGNTFLISENSGDAIIDSYTGDIKFSNSYTIFKNILPESSSTFDIGSSSLRFKDGWFSGDVYGGVGAWSSDRSLKENIEQIESTLGIIKKLNPVKYNFKGNSERVEYGFIAQDLEIILPNVVLKPNEKRKNYYVKYLDIIPILTKGIQEQQIIIDSLKAKLDQIFDLVRIKNEENINFQKEVLNQLPLLFHNHPNPFTGFTFIDYYLPPNTISAFIKVIDNNGKLVKAFPINQTGFGQIELDCQNLAVGKYYFSLIVNGVVADTKSMIKAAQR